jgi:hypothetical protein
MKEFSEEFKAKDEDSLKQWMLDNGYDLEAINERIMQQKQQIKE